MNSYDKLMAALDTWDKQDAHKVDIDNLVTAEDVRLAYRAHREAEGIWLEAVKNTCAGYIIDVNHGIVVDGVCYRLPQDVDDD